jgi:hypothetical protein
MSPTEHAVRTSLILLWSGWIAYTCFKRAIKPPKNRISRWYNEVEAVNRNPLIRLLNVVAGLLVLLIGISVVFGK